MYSKCIDKVQGGDGGEGGSKRPKDPMFGQWIKLQMSLNTTMNTTIQESFDEQVVRLISCTLTRQRRSSSAARATFVSNSKLSLFNSSTVKVEQDFKAAVERRKQKRALGRSCDSSEDSGEWLLVNCVL